MVSYLKMIIKSAKFSFHPKWWGAFFVANAVFFAFVLFYFLSHPVALQTIIELIASPNTVITVSTLFQDIGLMGAVFVIWELALFLVTGAYIYQAGGAQWKEGYRKAVKRYPSFVVVLVLYGILSTITTIVFPSTDIITFLLDSSVNILVLLFFGLASQSFILGKQGIVNSFKESLSIFTNKPLHVIAAQIISAVIASAISFVTVLLSVSIVLIGVVPGLIGTTDFNNAVLMLQGSMPLLVLAGIITVLGMALSQAFSLKFLSEFYTSIKK